MVYLGQWGDASLTLSLKPNALTVSINRGSQSEVYSYDRVGRLWTGLVDGISYRRGLNGAIVAKWKTGGEGRDRKWLSPQEAERLLDSTAGRMMALASAVERGKAHLTQAWEKEGQTWLLAAAAFDARHAARDAQAYTGVYNPVGILPPDQYMAVVLQLTEGCSFNTCSFCTFYRDRRFHIKTPDQFREHAQAVKAYLGAGLNLRRTIFLGDANALVVPMQRLLPLVDGIHQLYDVEALGGLYAFLDGFSGERKSAEDYRTLAQRGLKRVYIGLESGHDPLLAFLKKPGCTDDAIRAVQAIKAGGVAVGIIVLLGAGGHQYAAAHVADTVRALNAMPLDADDLIYFSELIESEGLPYTQDAYRSDLRPLTSAERIAQGEQIEQSLVFTPEGGTPHISRYDIREFVY